MIFIGIDPWPYLSIHTMVTMVAIVIHQVMPTWRLWTPRFKKRNTRTTLGDRRPAIVEAGGFHSGGS